MRTVSGKTKPSNIERTNNRLYEGQNRRDGFSSAGRNTPVLRRKKYYASPGKYVEAGGRTSNLDNRAHLNHLQETNSALSPLHIDVKYIWGYHVASRDNSQNRNSILFAPIVETIICYESHRNQSVMLIFKLLQIDEKEFNVSFAMKPAYKVLLTPEPTVKIVSTAIRLLGRRADIDHVLQSFISTKW